MLRKEEHTSKSFWSFVHSFKIVSCLTALKICLVLQRVPESGNADLDFYYSDDMRRQAEKEMEARGLKAKKEKNAEDELDELFEETMEEADKAIEEENDLHSAWLNACFD